MTGHEAKGASWLLVLLGLLGLALGAPGEAAAQVRVDQVIPVPYRPHDPTVPHPAYNGHPTTFKAIARGGCATSVGDMVLFRWDLDGDGQSDPCEGRTPTIDGASGRWYQDSRYNLGCRYQIPAVDPAVIEKKLVVGTVEVACLDQVLEDGSLRLDEEGAPHSVRGSYRVLVFARVPVGRAANDKGLYGYSARPVPTNGVARCVNGTCQSMPAGVTITCDEGRHDQCVGDSDESLAIKRAVAVDDALWYLHTRVVRVGADNVPVLSATMPNDGEGGGFVGASYAIPRSVAAAAATLQGLVQNGYAGAYPVARTVNADGSVTYSQSYDHDLATAGLQAHPDPAWTASNTLHWNNSPYAEDVIRLFNHLLATADGHAILAGIDAGNTLAGTADDRGLWWKPLDHTAYFAGPALAALAVSGLGGTVAQVACTGTNLCLGKRLESIVQQAVDGTCDRQARHAKNHSHDGSWCYTDGSCADLAIAGWQMRGLMAAEIALGERGVVIPPSCKERIPNLLWNSSRHTIDVDHGSGRYRNSTACTDGCTLDDLARDPHLTGNLLVGHGWLGSDRFARDDSTPVWSTTLYSDRTRGDLRERCDAAVGFLGRSWYAELGTGSCWTGSLFNYPNARFDGAGGGYLYSLFSVTRGLRGLPSQPATLVADTNGDRILDTEIDWWRDILYYLINNQHVDGYQRQLVQSGISAGVHAGTTLSTAWAGVLSLTPTSSSSAPSLPPVAVAQALTPTAVDEGCQAPALGKVTFSHDGSYHLDPSRRIVEYQWLFETSTEDVSADFDVVPWSELALDVPHAYPPGEPGEPGEPGPQRHALRTTRRDLPLVWRYLQAGTYTAALRVVDDRVNAQGDLDPATDVQLLPGIVVSSQPDLPPTADAGGPYELVEGESLQLAGTAGDPNHRCRADALQVAWHVPASAATPLAGVDAAGTVAWPTLAEIAPHNVPLPIELVVTDSTGRSTTATTTLTIWDEEFTPCFALLPGGEVGCQTAVRVDASCTSHPHAAVGFRDFRWQCDSLLPPESPGFVFHPQGAGLTAECRGVTPGTRHVVLQVTDGRGRVQYASRPLTLDARALPWADAGPPTVLSTWLARSWDGEAARQGGSVTLDGSGSTDPDLPCGDRLVRWEWDLTGDGVADDLDGSGAVDAADLVPRPALTWASLRKLLLAGGRSPEDLLASSRTGPPTLSVGLRVFDAGGQSGVSRSVLTILDDSPHARFTVRPDPAGCGALASPVVLDASGAWHGLPGRALRYEWAPHLAAAGESGVSPAQVAAQLDEAVTLGGQQVAVHYPAFGTYHPVLRITDDRGQVALAYGPVVHVEVDQGPPLVDPGGPYSWTVGEVLELDASATVDPDEACGDAPVLFEWDLDGDGLYGEAAAAPEVPDEPEGPVLLLDWARYQSWIPAAQFPARGLAEEPRWRLGLRVTDSRGQAATAELSVPIFDPTPVALVEVAPQPEVPINRATGKARVLLDGRRSHPGDPDRRLVGWTWTLLPRDAVATGPVASLEVDLNSSRALWEAGEAVRRQIRLRVEDDRRRTAETVLEVQFRLLASTPPVLGFAVNPIHLQRGDPLTVQATATPASGRTLEHVAWDLDQDATADRTWQRSPDSPDPGPALQLLLSPEELAAAGIDGIGEHPLTLVVTDSRGTPATATVLLVVLEQALQAEIHVTPREGTCATPFTFSGDGSRSLLPGGAVQRWSWDLGDGITAEGPHVGHTFAQAGKHRVTLTVTDDGTPPHTCSIWTEVSNETGNRPPVVQPNGPYRGDAELLQADPTARLALSAAGTSDPDSACGDRPQLFRWDLDGVPDGEGQPTWEVIVEEETVELSWAQLLGQWGLPQGQLLPVRLQVEDSRGATAEAETTLWLGSLGPVASFAVVPEASQVGEPMVFDATASYHPGAPDETIVSIEWDFAHDGMDFRPSSEHRDERLFHRLLASRWPFTVALRVTDGAGRSDVTTRVVTPSLGNLPPVARAASATLVEGEALVLDASASFDPDLALGDRVVRYGWDLGDDGVDPALEPWDFVSESPLLTLAWNEVRLFPFAAQALRTDPRTGLPVFALTLQVEDVAGEVGTQEVPLRFFGRSPVAVATVRPDTVRCGEELVFDGRASRPARPDRPIRRYVWDFDATVNTDAEDWDLDGIDTAWDDNQAEGAEVRWSGYTVAGTYDARLMVWDDPVRALARAGSAQVDPAPTLAFVDHPPLADAGGPYVAVPGEEGRISLELDGSGSADPDLPCDALVAYAWDTDGDGCFGEDDVAGQTDASGRPCAIGEELCGGVECVGARAMVQSPTAWPPGLVRVIALKVRDRYGLWSNPAETTLEVLDRAPPAVQLVTPAGGEVLAGTRDIVLRVTHSTTAQARLLLYLDDVLLTSEPDHLLVSAGTEPVTVRFPLDTTRFPSRHEAYRVKVVATLAADPAVARTVLSRSPFSIDNDAPVLTVLPEAPAPLEQTSRDGSSLRFTVSVSDLDPAPVLQFWLDDLPQGVLPTVFPLGTSRLRITATDWAGSPTTLERVVVVQDTTPPVLLAGMDVIREAVSPAGTPAPLGSFGYDLCDARVGAAAVTSDAPAAGLFPLGETPVTLTVTDASGNEATASLKVTVTDTTPPVFHPLPAVVRQRPTDPRGILARDLAAHGLLPGPIYSDNGYPTHQLVCRLEVTLRDEAGQPLAPPAGPPRGYPCTAPPAGDWWPAAGWFPQGETLLTYTLQDPAGNVAVPLTVQVVIAESEGPTITLLTVPAGDVWLTDDAAVRFVVTAATGRPQVVVAPAPLGGEADLLPDEDGLCQATYAADGLWQVSITATDQSGQAAVTALERFGIDRTGPLLQITGLDQVGVVAEDGTTWPLFFRGETLAPRFFATDGLSGLQWLRVQVVPGTGQHARGDSLHYRLLTAAGRPATGPRFLGNLGCPPDAAVCAAGVLSLEGLKPGGQRLLFEAQDVANNKTALESRFRLGTLADALTTVRQRLAAHLTTAEPGPPRLLVEEADTLLSGAQRSFAAGDLGSALVGVYLAQDRLTGVRWRLSASSPEDGFGPEAELLARGCLAEVRSTLEQTARGTSREQPARLALARAEEFLAEDREYGAALGQLARAFFVCREAAAPLRASSVAAALLVLRRIHVEIVDGVQDPSRSGTQELTILLADLEAGALARLESLADLGWLPTSELLALHLDLQQLAGGLAAAESQGRWVRSWQWGLAQVLRVVTELVRVDAQAAIPPGHPQYCKIAEVQQLQLQGQRLLEHEEPELLLQLYGEAGPCRCLLLELYHHAGFEPAIPGEPEGCVLEGCSG